MSSWQDAISDSFPPPHEREPSNLRADIRDELADHLECATRRELLKARDESVARQAALERFGDPKTIACRLWWGHMKGRIMKDRLFTVVFTFCVIAVLAALVLEFAARQNAIAAKQNAINEAMLAKLNALSTPPPASRPTLPENWASLKVVVREQMTDRPIESANLTLEGKPFTDTDNSNLREMTDKEGRAIYGPIRPGPYQVRVRVSAENGVLISTSQGVTLYAGQEREISFTTPMAKIASDLTLHVTAPKYLENMNVIAVYALSQKPILSDKTVWSGSCEGIIAVSLIGNSWTALTHSDMPPNRMFGLQFKADAFPLHWAAGTYQIDSITICLRAKEGNVNGWRSLGTLAPKDLAFQVKAGACRVELPLPHELVNKVLVSPNLSVPVTFGFSHFDQSPDEFLIKIGCDVAALDATQSEAEETPRRRREGSPSAVSYNLLFSNKGQVLRSEEFEFRYGLASGPRAQTTQPVQHATSMKPEFSKESARLLPQGRYTITSVSVFRREHNYGGKQLRWESCGNADLPAPQQMFEVRIDRKNEVTIQIPKDLIETCTATTTSTHPE